MDLKYVAGVYCIAAIDPDSVNPSALSLPTKSVQVHMSHMVAIVQSNEINAIRRFDEMAHLFCI